MLHLLSPVLTSTNEMMESIPQGSGIHKTEGTHDTGVPSSSGVENSVLVSTTEDILLEIPTQQENDVNNEKNNNESSGNKNNSKGNDGGMNEEGDKERRWQEEIRKAKLVYTNYGEYIDIDEEGKEKSKTMLETYCPDVIPSLILILALVLLPLVISAAFAIYGNYQEIERVECHIPEELQKAYYQEKYELSSIPITRVVSPCIVRFKKERMHDRSFLPASVESLRQLLLDLFNQTGGPNDDDYYYVNTICAHSNLQPTTYPVTTAPVGQWLPCYMGRVTYSYMIMDTEYPEFFLGTIRRLHRWNPNLTHPISESELNYQIMYEETMNRTFDVVMQLTRLSSLNSSRMLLLSPGYHIALSEALQEETVFFTHPMQTYLNGLYILFPTLVTLIVSLGVVIMIIIGRKVRDIVNAKKIKSRFKGDKKDPNQMELPEEQRIILEENEKRKGIQLDLTKGYKYLRVCSFNTCDQLSRCYCVDCDKYICKHHETYHDQLFMKTHQKLTVRKAISSEAGRKELYIVGISEIYGRIVFRSASQALAYSILVIAALVVSRVYILFDFVRFPAGSLQARTAYYHISTFTTYSVVAIFALSPLIFVKGFLKKKIPVVFWTYTIVTVLLFAIIRLITTYGIIVPGSSPGDYAISFVYVFLSALVSSFVIVPLCFKTLMVKTSIAVLIPIIVTMLVLLIMITFFFRVFITSAGVIQIIMNLSIQLIGPVMGIGSSLGNTEYKDERISKLYSKRGSNYIDVLGFILVAYISRFLLAYAVNISSVAITLCFMTAIDVVNFSISTSVLTTSKSAQLSNPLGVLKSVTDSIIIVFGLKKKDDDDDDDSEEEEEDDDDEDDSKEEEENRDNVEVGKDHELELKDNVADTIQKNEVSKMQDQQEIGNEGKEEMKDVDISKESNNSEVLKEADDHQVVAGTQDNLQVKARTRERSKSRVEIVVDAIKGKFDKVGNIDYAKERDKMARNLIGKFMIANLIEITAILVTPCISYFLNIRLAIDSDIDVLSTIIFVQLGFKLLSNVICIAALYHRLKRQLFETWNSVIKDGLPFFALSQILVLYILTQFYSYILIVQIGGSGGNTFSILKNAPVFNKYM